MTKKRKQIYGVDLSKRKEIRDQMTQEEWKIAEEAAKVDGPGTKKCEKI